MGAATGRAPGEAGRASGATRAHSFTGHDGNQYNLEMHRAEHEPLCALCSAYVKQVVAEGRKNRARA